MSTEFKPGDKVRCVDATNCTQLDVDRVYTVANCDYDYVYIGDDINNGWWIHRFELVHSDTPRVVGDLLFKDPGHVLESDTGGKKNMRITRYDLLPPEALAEIATVFGKGDEKYPDAAPGEMNWELGMDWSWLSRAALTHIAKWQHGIDFDEDDNAHHLAHAAAVLMMLLAYQARNLGTDTRSKSAVAAHARASRPV